MTATAPIGRASARSALCFVVALGVGGAKDGSGWTVDWFSGNDGAARLNAPVRGVECSEVGGAGAGVIVGATRGAAMSG